MPMTIKINEETPNLSAAQLLVQHIEAHPTLPVEAIFKADLLRRGLSFAADALQPIGNSAEHSTQVVFHLFVQYGPSVPSWIPLNSGRRRKRSPFRAVSSHSAAPLSPCD